MGRMIADHSLIISLSWEEEGRCKEGGEESKLDGSFLVLCINKPSFVSLYSLSPLPQCLHPSNAAEKSSADQFLLVCKT